MSQSLSKVNLHCVFTTKYGLPTITDYVRNDLHAYIIGTLSNIGSYVHEIYANPDHIHVLCTLPRTITISKLISNIKTPSSKWLKAKGINNFAWQDGYGVFSVSQSKISVVKNYIINQQIHHKTISFKDEFRKLLNEYEVEFDERYIWD